MISFHFSSILSTTLCIHFCIPPIPVI
jgi:hypothetical protein